MNMTSPDRLVNILTTGIKLTYLAKIDEDVIITSYIQCHRRSDWLRAACSGYQIPVEARFYFPSRQVREQTSPLYIRYRVFPRVKEAGVFC